jgi:hypothetical protein
MTIENGTAIVLAYVLRQHGRDHRVPVGRVRHLSKKILFAFFAPRPPEIGFGTLTLT